MRIGLSTPVVVQVPGVCSDWERDGDIDDLVSVAAAADELGFDHMTCSEHVAVPVDLAAQRGAAYWDPVATLAYLAACTRQIRLAASVVVLGYHHPLALAKTYGTLDRVSGGRLILGVGVGSLREEFEMLSASWEDRGVRADDALRALRASLSRPQPSYSGTHYSFERMVVQPHAVQDRVPIWVGGHSLRSLRRALELADGWAPFGLSARALGDMLAAADLSGDFEVALAPGRPLDPLGDPGVTRGRLRALREVGATVVTAAVSAESCDHYCDQLGMLRKLADTIS